MSDHTAPASQLRLLGGCHLDGVEGEPNAAQVKRLALLAYLACTAASPPTRERLCALFWPELDDASARHSLRQSLYSLRQLVGADAITGRGQFVTIDPVHLGADVLTFERNIAEGRRADALALYGGDLLDGVHVSGASAEFESWLDGARQRLRSLAVDAARKEADAEGGAGRLANAERYLRFAEGLHPLDEDLARRRMRVLARLGNRGAAVECYTQLATRLRSQLDVEPSDATRALLREVSTSAEPAAAVPAPASPGESGPAGAPTHHVPAQVPLTAPWSAAPTGVVVASAPGAAAARPGTRSRLRGWWAIGGVAAAAALAIVNWRAPRREVPPAAPDASARRTGRDLVARGTQAFCRGELDGARSLLASAAAADPTSAEAAFGQSVVAEAMGRGEERAEALRRAERLATTDGTNRSLQLLARATQAELANDRAWRPLAESLAVQHPTLAAGVASEAWALVWSGDFASARALVHDASRRADLVVSLPLCERGDLAAPAITAALLLDSLDAAEHEAREWVRASPASRAAHYQLATVLQRQGRSREALFARQSSIRASSAIVDDAPARAEMALLDGRFAEAEGVLSERVRDARPEVRGDALWWITRLRREQGRARDAIQAARELRATATRDEGPAVGLGLAVVEAQAMLEGGMPREAAMLFDSLANVPAVGLEASLPPDNGLTARRRAWALAHVAAARAAAGDTIALRTLVDSIRTIGARSAFGRDQRLHHHVLGELLIARGDTAGAIRELQLATYSLTDGYTRTSLLLGRLLIARHRVEEAIGILQAALRAPMDGSALYTTRTEVHEALADALAGAGRLAEARTMYTRVADAWQAADPPFTARARRARLLAGATFAAGTPGRFRVQ